jgi:leucyl aminopeptidase
MAVGAGVAGVMQLDMSNYKDAANDIYLYIFTDCTDYTDAAQSTFAANLIETYLPTLKIGGDRCGYACSDHASWSAQGYDATRPFESSFAADNSSIHTAHDTYANSGNQAEHSLKFARMSLACAVELGADGAGTPPVDKTESFSGNLTLNQAKAFGPFILKAGGTLKASTSSHDRKSDGSSATETCTVKAAANSD